MCMNAHVQKIEHSCIDTLTQVNTNDVALSAESITEIHTPVCTPRLSLLLRNTNRPKECRSNYILRQMRYPGYVYTLSNKMLL